MCRLGTMFLQKLYLNTGNKMKIYLSIQPPEDDLGYTWVPSLAALDSMVQDSEATSIVVDNFLSSEEIDKVGEMLFKIVKKMRINSEIIFYQQDIDLVCHEYSRASFNLEALNQHIFSFPETKSVFNTDILCSALDSLNLEITNKQLNPANFQGVVKARRPYNGTNQSTNEV